MVIIPRRLMFEFVSLRTVHWPYFSKTDRRQVSLERTHGVSGRIAVFLMASALLLAAPVANAAARKPHTVVLGRREKFLIPRRRSCVQPV